MNKKRHTRAKRILGRIVSVASSFLAGCLVVASVAAFTSVNTRTIETALPVLAVGTAALFLAALFAELATAAHAAHWKGVA